MSVNDTKKVKRKINAVDVLIILLVIALIATVAFRIYTEITEKTHVSSGNYVITFECKDQYNSVLEYLKNGEKVYFSANGKVLGYLYDPDLDDSVGATWEITSADGGADEADAAKKEYRKINVGGKIRLSGEAVKIKDGGHYAIGDTNITVGSSIVAYTDEVKLTLKVVDISEID